MLYCPVSDQSDIKMKRSADAGTSLLPEYRDSVRYLNALVPDKDDGCQNANADGIGLDADGDAQLC